MEKTLSIIIPHYNSPAKLGRLLNTIPERDEIEVIVVDDCSTKSLEEFEEVKEAHPGVLFLDSKKNGGPGQARNIGLDRASGEFILFSDSDDYFAKDMWESVSFYLDKDFDVVLFPPTSVFEGTDKMADRHQTSEKIVNDFRVKHDEKSVLTARYMMVLNLSRIIRRSVIEENGIRFLDQRYFEDAIFAMTTGLATDKFEASDKVIYVITKTEGTETYNKDPEKETARRRLSYERAKLLKKSLNKSERKLLNAGNELVLRRYKEYKQNVLARVFYGVYYRVFGTKLG